MKDKRICCAVMAAVMLGAALTGCRESSLSAAEQSETSAAETTTETAAVSVTAPPETTSAAETEAPQQRFTFQPKVCSSYTREVYGETMCEAWFALVDAVMAGENTFACPDSETYDWVMGGFAPSCCPVLVGKLINDAEDPDHPVQNGIGHFGYAIPKEELAQEIDRFAKAVEEILSETMQADYTDFEKMLSLYQYFAKNFEYDHELAAGSDPEMPTPCHVLYEKKGICSELSFLYSYLLLLAGVDATTMSGIDSYDQVPHQWSYVKLNGKNYHIDPTFALGDAALSFFLETDAEREQDRFLKKDSYIVSNYSREHPHPEYAADDDTFSVLWRMDLVTFDHETKTLYYTPRVYPKTEQEPQAFSYDGY